MTSPEMNAYRAKKTIGALAALASLAGCASAFDPATDAASPVAPRVQALVDANRIYPRWADFPATPDDLPRPVEVAARVNTLRATGGALAGEAARIEWLGGDPVAFSSEVQARVDAQAIAPVTVQTQAEVEAFAARTRQRGAAPPPLDRSPPSR